MNTLHIVVCMKPVPDPSQWKKLALDPQTLLLRRADLPAVMNPLDRHAIGTAVRLKSKHGGRVSVLTMAPPDAEEQLLEALAMGCDAAFLLTDPAFAGADTLATARCLKAAIAKIGAFDLVVCGASSLDGSTSQVGPQLAELLGVLDVTFATSLELHERALQASCKLDDGAVDVEVDLPALVTISNEEERPELPSMTGIAKALETSIVRWGPADLGLDPAEVGLRGSPTQMSNISMATTGRKGEIIPGTPSEQVASLLRKLHLQENSE